MVLEVEIEQVRHGSFSRCCLQELKAHTIFLLKRGARDLKKQNMHGAASLEKKEDRVPH